MSAAPCVRQDRARSSRRSRRFFEQQLGRLSGKLRSAKTIRYALKHWDGLTRFLDDGRIDLDTNIVERSMRPQALTRKNALFAGHDDGAENWAILASLIETANSPASILRLSSPTSSPASSISGPTIASTNSCPGLGPPRASTRSALPELALALHIFGAQSSENPKGAETPLTLEAGLSGDKSAAQRLIFSAPNGSRGWIALTLCEPSFAISAWLKRFSSNNRAATRQAAKCFGK